MPERVEPPARNDRGEETHPAWGMVSAHRSYGGDATLFDSDIRHRQTITVRIATARRKRDLHRDWKGRDREFVEVQMSEAQWASFVSSMDSGEGVPCTIRRREDGEDIPGMPPESRLAKSIEEVKGKAEEAFAAIEEAFAAYEEKRSAANRRTLKFAIANAPANIAFASDSLTEHAEDVIQKARIDIEGIVSAKAQQLGLDPGEIGFPLLEPGDDS